MSEGTIAEVLAGEALWCVVHGEGVSVGERPEGAEWGERDVLAGLPDLSADHVLTDPPYSRHVHTRQRRLTVPDSHTAPSRAIREAALGFDYLSGTTRRAFARHAARLTRGWVVAFSDFESVATLRRSFEAAGLRHWRCGAWDKCDTGAPQFNGMGPASWGEAIEFASHVALEIAHSTEPFAWEAGGKRAVWRHITEIARGGGVEVKHERGARHSTAKPLPLMLDLVGDFSSPNDLILDPFAGSGTTGVAALRLGRRVILIEREPKWAELCRERLRAEDEGSTLAARRAGQVPMFG